MHVRRNFAQILPKYPWRIRGVSNSTHKFRRKGSYRGRSVSWLYFRVPIFSCTRELNCAEKENLSHWCAY